MNDHEQDRLEEALRRIPPAAPPEPFMTKLFAARPAAEPVAQKFAPQPHRLGWGDFLRWLVPAMATVVVAAVVWRSNFSGSAYVPQKPALKADNVQIDHELVSAFDAVGLSPSGEPVRYRCQEWVDKVEMRDTARGVAVQQSAPRLEVTQVGYEVY